jgi:hypothetical protein
LTSESSKPGVWEIIAIVALSFFAAWKLYEVCSGYKYWWPGASGIGGFIGGMVADPRVWLLVLALYLLHRKRLKSTKGV